jgi:hypothetical protein
MSTKTTFKRIALVAVAALGFGTLAVVPASAELPADRNSVTAVSFGLTQQQGAASVARVGVATSFSVALTTGSAVTYAGGSTLQINTYVRFSAVPATETTLGVGSNISPTLTAATISTGSVVSFGGGSGATLVATGVSGVTPGYLAISTASAGAAIVGSQSKVVIGTASFTPSVVGTYKVQGWVDNATAGNTAGAADALERSATKTIVVGGTPTAIVVKSLGTAAAVGTTVPGNRKGHVFQVSLTDTAGNKTSPIPGESVGVTLSGGAGGTVSDASLTAADFNNNGFAYVTITGAADIASSTYTFSATGFTATAVPLSMTATLANAQASSVTFTQTTGLSAGSGFASTINTAQATTTTVARAITFATGKAVTMRVTSGSSAAATSRVVGVNIIDSYGDVHGDDNSGLGLGGGTVNYSAAVAIDDTLGYGSITLPTTGLAAGDSIDVLIYGTDGSATSTITLTAADVALNALSTLSPATASIVTGGGIELTAQCVDAYAQPVGNCAVSWNVAALSRNATTVPTQKLADANGYSTYLLTDTSTSTTVLTDTVSATMTFGSSTVTKTATITWGAANAVSAIAVTTSPTKTVATTESAISTAATGPEAGAVTLAFTVTDANGVGIAGVPVTFSADSTNVSWKSASTDVSNRKLAYTSSTGVATTYIAGWVAPSTVTVTATAGTKTVTTKINFVTVAADARTIALTTSGNIAVATVKDRFGNPVKGASVTWSRTGAGYFGSGVSTATGTTDVNGVTEILVVGEATVSAELAVATYAQVDDASGFVGTTATSGTGATLAPAGIAKATLAVSAAASDAAATAAADAAAEATDAANAATDAANAAAEAADAATAAAQDAADAVAALSTSVTEMVNALKKQITSLTNLVIKIQKKVRA